MGADGCEQAELGTATLTVTEATARASWLVRQPPVPSYCGNGHPLVRENLAISGGRCVAADAERRALRAFVRGTSRRGIGA